MAPTHGLTFIHQSGIRYQVAIPVLYILWRRCVEHRSHDVIDEPLCCRRGDVLDSSYRTDSLAYDRNKRGPSHCYIRSTGIIHYTYGRP